MRIEPDLDQEHLIELLRDRYRLDPTGLTFIPYGIDSWSFRATCGDGSEVFIKLSRRATAIPWEAPLLAALAARRVAVPRPLPDRQGGFLNAVDGYDVQLYEYLHGHTLEGEVDWPDDLYARVALIVAAVHASTSAVRDLVERREHYELPFLAPFLSAMTAIEDGAELPAGEDPSLSALRDMVLPRVSDVRAAIDRLESLSDRARTRDSDEVLCHTDIWGSNLLRSDDGALHLLDWDGALLGPAEHDLFMFAGTDFFPAERFGWFLDRYRAAGGQARLDPETFAFYVHRRTLEDLASFVGAIADGRMEAMDGGSMLDIVAANLAELGRLEDRGHRVSAVLATDRGSSA